MSEKDVVETKEGKIKLNTRKWLHQYGMITLGVLLLDIGYYFFLDPAKIVTGGVMGISIIVEPLLAQIGPWFTASIFMYIVNVILLIIGGIFLGKDFFIKTIYATLIQPSFILILELAHADPNYFFSQISTGNEKIVCLICGALLSGIGIGITIKFNGSTGGMDVVQKIMSKYMKVPMSIAIYLTDAIVVLVSGFVFTPSFGYQIENVVYGTIGVFVTAYIIDFIALSLRPRRTVNVITHNPDLIKQLVYDNFDRGVTFSRVEGAYTGSEMTMVICTMDKNESYRMMQLISERDPKAFTFVTSCKEVRGEYERKRFF